MVVKLLHGAVEGLLGNIQRRRGVGRGTEVVRVATRRRLSHHIDGFQRRASHKRIVVDTCNRAGQHDRSQLSATRETLIQQQVNCFGNGHTGQSGTILKGLIADADNVVEPIE